MPLLSSATAASYIATVAPGHVPIYDVQPVCEFITILLHGNEQLQNAFCKLIVLQKVFGTC